MAELRMIFKTIERFIYGRCPDLLIIIIKLSTSTENYNQILCYEVSFYRFCNLVVVIATQKRFFVFIYSRKS